MVVATCSLAADFFCQNLLVAVPNTELSADTPEVTTALLKFMAEFVLNKTQVG